MDQRYFKTALIIVVLLEIVSIFVMLHFYNDLTSDPSNYFSTSVVYRPEKINQPEKRPLVKKIMIENVPFTTQSPDAAWDPVAQELCEEASMIIVDHYWSKKPLNKNIALSELGQIKQFEVDNYGDYRDENAAQIAQRLRDYFGYSDVVVYYDFSLDFLKEKIAEGRPIIVPAAGRELHNSNFRPPGPLYHALVIVGHDGNNFITNDPGTRKGEGWKYEENIIFEAIHDFPGSKEAILQGRRAMVIVNE
ncbi:MAG: C39 family peptidase [Candidatus Portnoybacteria bacterium]|nr:C39 family peptidase [Candidatus Portnoybacteria bacterium]